MAAPTRIATENAANKSLMVPPLEPERADANTAYRASLRLGIAGRRLHEPRCVDRRVRLDSTQFDRHLHVGLARGPGKRHPDARDIPVVVVVDLGGHRADRGLVPSYHPDEQTRTVV